MSARMHSINYSDIGRPYYRDLKGEVRVFLSRSQLTLLQKYVHAQLHNEIGWLPNLRFVLLHMRMLLTYPRLFALGEYYDPDNFDLVEVEELGRDKVCLVLRAP